MKHFGLLILAALFVGCSSPPPVPPSGMAILRGEAKRGSASRTFNPHLVIREIDHREMEEDLAEAGIPIKPGSRSVLVSMISHAGSTVGQLSMGRVGGAVGTAFDELHSIHFERLLHFTAEAGHAYKACVLDTGNGYRYWIEDETARRIVAGSRDF